MGKRHAFARAFAPAKINLTLHVTGQRPDGYHLLDSLVMLADVGDFVTVTPSDRLSLTITGPRAKGVPTDSNNLVLRAANMMGLAAAVTLDKHLPAAAGIGGGSSDAAACLRALSKAYDLPLPGTEAQLSLGADVPVCMAEGLVRMRGIGEEITVLGEAPDWPMILVNPGSGVATGSVFSRLERKDNAPMTGDFPIQSNWREQVEWLVKQRNDLENPAIAEAPVIGDILNCLRHLQGCLMARMSGSGATCFAIMENDASRSATVAQLRTERPEWWVVPANRCKSLSG